jgi:hypothetical protein
MSHGFDSYRIFISAPGDLDADRHACHEAISAVNEVTAMPAKILLVPVGLRDNAQLEGNRSIVSDNVRWSNYFIQLFEDDWGPRNLFRKVFLLAVECRDDPSMPMRDVVVCLKRLPDETDPDIIALRKELQQRQDVRIVSYSNRKELSTALFEICTAWTNALVQTAPASNAVAPALRNQ